MTTDQLNDLELAALQCIAAQYPHVDTAALNACVATKRENTGAGFFTSLTVEAGKFKPIDAPSPLGDVWIKIDGMQYGIGCLLFLTDGLPSLLEGYSFGDEGTSEVDFGAVTFSVSADPTWI